jgi:predicted metal-dependent hydrolase
MGEGTRNDPADRDRPLLREGVALFNRGEYHEAHEVLETAWRRLRGDERQVYQALIQVATAFHFAVRARWRGAVLLLPRALRRLRTFGPACAYLDLEEFADEVEAVYDTIRECDRGAGSFDPDRLPRLPPPRVTPSG